MKSKQGQTIVMLLVFMLIAITVTTAAIAIVILNSRASNLLQQGTVAYYVAESGAEDALMRLLRNPNFTGETLTVGTGTAVVTISGTTTKTILSTSTLGTYARKIQIIVGYNNNILTIQSWKEVY